MRVPRWLVPAGLVLASVAWAAALAAYARGGVRRETVLSQREVGASYARSDETALWLTIQWMQPYDSVRGGWVGMPRLAALGLDTIPAQGPGSTDAYAVLELGGRGFDAWVEQRVAEFGRQFADTVARRDSLLASHRASLLSGTRLLLVDVGRDAQALAAKYPDPATHLILAANVRTAINYVTRDEKGPNGVPRSDSVLTSYVDVRGTRMLVTGDAAAPFRRGPRPLAYDVTVATGRGGVAWVVGVKER